VKRRLEIRISNQYVLEYATSVRELFNQDLIKTLVFLAIGSANLSHLDVGTNPRYARLDDPPPNTERRPIKAYWLAQSLGLPRETVGRKVRALIAEGRLISTDTGLIAPASAFEQENLTAHFRITSSQLADFSSRLARAGIDDVPRLGLPLDSPDFPHRAVGRIAAAFFLRAMDEIRQVFSGEFLTGLVLCGIVDANTNYISDLPGQPFANLEDQVPDAMRRPITAIALAEKLGLPRETARRHIRTLEQHGMCTATPSGLVVTQASLGKSDVIAATVRNHSNVQVMLNQLRILVKATGDGGSRRPSEAAPHRRTV
jgi:predicted transcriptional regulator